MTHVDLIEKLLQYVIFLDEKGYCPEIVNKLADNPLRWTDTTLRNEDSRRSRYPGITLFWCYEFCKAGEPASNAERSEYIFAFESLALSFQHGVADIQVGSTPRKSEGFRCAGRRPG